MCKCVKHSFSTGASTNENGIAFFEEPTGAFPFSEGLLLASGDANGAAGPNTNTGFSSGSISWDGDTDLTTLAGNLTYNATTIEFNFVPYSTEISFRFLMASEEYGDSWFECNYSDVFAFFLTHPDGTVSNLAVLPGTTTPVLVTTVHPDNSDCLVLTLSFLPNMLLMDLDLLNITVIQDRLQQCLQ